MSECVRHGFEWYGHNTSRCVWCGLVVPDEIADILKYKPDSVEDSSAREWVEAVLQDRREMQAQVALLRGALRWYEDSVSDCPKCGGSGLIDDNQLWTCSECNGSGSAGHKAKKALSATPAEAAERVQRLVDALEDLARLGGPGVGYGNSAGNDIAIAALKEWRRQP